MTSSQTTTFYIICDKKNINRIESRTKNTLGTQSYLNYNIPGLPLPASGRDQKPKGERGGTGPNKTNTVL